MKHLVAHKSRQQIVFDVADRCGCDACEDKPEDFACEYCESTRYIWSNNVGHSVYPVWAVPLSTFVQLDEEHSIIKYHDGTDQIWASYNASLHRDFWHYWNEMPNRRRQSIKDRGRELLKTLGLAPKPVNITRR